jgi:CRISPR/Cas system-associated exonuclease Cas4 (RecB family)
MVVTGLLSDLTSDTIPAPFEEPELIIKAASYSRLTEFEKCKYRAKLLFVEKIKEPQRPLPPGKTEQANDRGTRIHEAAELFVKSENRVELIPELSDFREEFEKLRELHSQGLVSLEGEWAFDESWQPCAYYSDTTWMRVKLDAMVTLGMEHAAIIDYKTGRRSGNEVKHADQMALYALAVFMRYPKVQKVTVELFYTDQNDLARQVYTREQGLRYLKNFNKRFLAMTTCEDFPPNPNDYSCRWCYFGPKGSGVCKTGR